jgi:winged helix DNA-binding protein
VVNLSGSRSLLVRQRWRAQGLSGPLAKIPEEIVRRMGAVQAQEYGPAKWALGLRLPAGIAESTVERAIQTGRILRTHLLRPTWHFVAAEDIRWILELTAPQVHRRMATYNHRLELHARLMNRAIGIIERALGESNSLTRREIGVRLERAGLPGRSTHLAHIMMHAELEGLICSGPRQGKQFTYALLSERAPRARSMPREEALAELTRRYLKTHGPATVRDFVWWSGLKTTDAKRGLEMNRAESQVVDGVTYWSLGPAAKSGRGRETLVQLLPVYDEYLVAYRDLSAVPRPAYLLGGFQHSLVIAGQVAGTWRTMVGKNGVEADVSPNRRLTATERRDVSRAVARYQSFVNR